MEDRSYVAKMLWKKAAMKIIIRIQAYKFFEKIRRNKRSVVEISKMLPYLQDDKDGSYRGDESQRYLEGETILYPRNDDAFVRGGGGHGRVLSSIMKKRAVGNKLDVVSEVSEMGKSGTGEPKKSEDDDADSSRISVVSGGNIPASSVYEIINKAVNKEKLSIAFPKSFLKRVQYMFLIPLTHA